jgi:Helicase conserved C-terminal domain/Type III restriction enzyme, res subunit
MILMPNGMSLRDHQKKVVQHMLELAKRTRSHSSNNNRHKGLIVAHSMGKGKTVTALATALALAKAGHIDHLFVAAPNTVQEYWQKNISNMGFSEECPDLKVTLGTHHGGMKGFLSSLPSAGRVFFVVDEAHNMRTTIVASKKRRNKNKNKKEDDGDGQDALTTTRTTQKNARGPTKAEAMLKIASAAKFVLMLTGTPVVNHFEEVRNLIAAVRGEESMSQMRMDYPELFFNSGFKSSGSRPPAAELMRYARMPRYANVFSVCVDPPPTVTTGHHSASSSSSSTASEGMPTVIEEHIRITMPPDYLAWYLNIEQNVEHLVEGEGKKKTDNMAFIHGVRRAVNGTQPGARRHRSRVASARGTHKYATEENDDDNDDGDYDEDDDDNDDDENDDDENGNELLQKSWGPKLERLQRMMQEWFNEEADADGETKVILYSGWLGFGVSMVAGMVEHLSVPIEYGVIHGQLTNAARQRIIDAYNSSRVRLLLFTAAGAEGMDLKGTTHVVILEPHWHMARLRQAIARAVRMGSHDHLPLHKRQVHVHHMILQKPAADGPGPNPSQGRSDGAGAGVGPSSPSKKPSKSKPSADDMLLAIMQEKEAWYTDAFLPFAKGASIEREKRSEAPASTPAAPSPARAPAPAPPRPSAPPQVPKARAAPRLLPPQPKQIDYVDLVSSSDYDSDY